MLYPVAIEIGNDDTAYGVVVPDIEGCFSAGDSYEEALLNAREAIQFHLEGIAETGELPPAASTIDDHFNKPEFKGWVWALVDIDIDPYMGRSKKYNVTLPTLLRVKIDHLVDSHPEVDGFSQFIQEAVQKNLSNYN